MKHSLLAFILFLVTGCAAIGPVSSPEFPTLVNNAIPAEEGKVRLFGPANWFPNAFGFTDVRSAYLVGGTQPIIPGVCVITETSLIFLQWHEPQQRFEPIKRIRNSEMLSVTLDTYGLNRRMVVRKHDLSYDSFDFSSDSGTMVDAEKVEAGVALLQSRVR